MSRRLYDLILRHQIYLDGYKAHQVQEWQKCLPGLVKDLRNEFANVPYDNLDDFTKKEFNEFKRNIAKVIGYHFSFWQNALMKELEEFCKVDDKLEKQIIANHLANPEEENTYAKIATKDSELDEVFAEHLPKEEKKRKLTPLLWAYLLNDIMGATGKSAKQTIESLSIETIERFNAQINMAWANNETMKELQDSLIGTAKLKYADGKLKTVNNNVVSAIETVIQSFAVTIQTEYTSRFFKKWQWKAILDNRLCEVCGFLHNKIFIYGFGPACPAHRKCRCSKVPYTGLMPDEASANAWKLEQPKSVQLDFLKSTTLTLEEYASKLSNILTR